MTKKVVMIHKPFITLGQLLKNEAIVGSGGMAKWYLSENTVYVNKEIEQRRGCKLYPGDIVTIESEQSTYIIQSENHED